MMEKRTIKPKTTKEIQVKFTWVQRRRIRDVRTWVTPSNNVVYFHVGRSPSGVAYLDMLVELKQETRSTRETPRREVRLSLRL